jgi:UDPglucose 6-dehydrogenase
LRGKRLAVLGLAFKGDTDDVRESPAIEIVQALLREGTSVCVYDPAGTAKARPMLPARGIEYAKGPYNAMNGADALLILTDWQEFGALDLQEVRDRLKYPIVIDGRNLYEPDQMAEAGLIYHSIGRAVGVPKHLAPVVGHPREETVVSGPLRESVAATQAAVTV